MIGSDRGTSAV